MKTYLSVIFFCCALLFTVQSYSQRSHPETANTPGVNAYGNTSPGGYFDIIFDRFGRQYTLNQVAADDAVRLHSSGRQASAGSPAAPSAPTEAYTGCTPGYFRIYLEAGCGMDLYATNPTNAARLNVLCQVLTDIAAFVPSPCTASGQTVNIWVRAGLTIGLGSATPFFNVPYSLTKTGIADNTVWETLNSGVDAFKNIAPPLSTSGGGTTGTGGGGSVYFHGSIAFNFAGVTWHNDLHTTPVSGEADLYSVALHEMMHVLGFCTLIDYNGRSVFDMFNTPPVPATYQYYSRYDRQLQTGASAPLITGSASGCDMYQYSFNPAAGIAGSVLSPGGASAPGCSTGFYTGSGETSNTVCSTAIKYLGGWGSPIPVYTPACYERGGSLSHFDDQCYVPSGFCPACTTTNEEYFVMSNSAPSPSLGGYSVTTNPGVMKRYLTPEERAALCDLGYNVLTTFGNSANLNNHSYGGTACPGTQVVGFNDGITDTGTYALRAIAGAPVYISGPALGTTILDNDRAAGTAMSAIAGSSFKCLEVVTGSGTVSTTTGTATTDVIYSAGATDFGIELLRYIPVNATGEEGNITYIYVYVGNPACVPSACNLVVNGGFENPASGVYGEYIPGEYCWSELNFAPMLLATDAPSTPSPGEFYIPNTVWYLNGTLHPLSPGSNHHYVSLYTCQSPSGLWGSSSIQEQLSAPLDSGQQYTITFWGLLGGLIDTVNAASHLQFAVGDTYPLTGTVSGAVPTSFMPAGFTSLAEFTIVPNNHLWQLYSLDVIYIGHSNAGTLFIQSAPWDDADTIVYFHDSTKNIGIDDISIVPTAAACAFSVPGPVSALWPPFNLAAYAHVCVSGGTFSWPTMPILPGGVPTTSTSGTFNPSDAYAAAMAAGDTTAVTVAYTYTTASGCVQTVYTTVRITDTLLPRDTTVTDTILAVRFNVAASKQLYVYPNPAKDILNIDFPDMTSSSQGSRGWATYRLLSIMG